MVAKHTRREVIRWIGTGGAALVIGVRLPLARARARADASETTASGPFEPNVFVRIGTDSLVTVQIKHIEFGQGPATGLATLVAEELDADWAQMRAELAPANIAYANLFFGVQGTGGSSAIANSFTQMRAAGAAARAMLVAAAAKRWKVPAAQIAVSKGVVQHERSGRKAQFGELVLDAAKQTPPKEPRLKAPEAWTLIGTDVPKLDTADKTRGATMFTLDHYPEGVVTAVVARPPAFGATPKSVDDSAAKAVPGVLKVATLPKGVAVYASSTYAALKGRDALRVEWDMGGAETRSSEAMFATYSQVASAPGVEATARGDLAQAFAPGAKTLEAEYRFPFLAHAPMEPLDAVVQVGEGGAVVWMGSQMPTTEQMAMAQVLGLTPETVELRTQYAGGSFGRRAEPDAGFAVEAALVAKAYGDKAPVKLMWTRVDDIRGGRYRPLTVQRLRGALDGSGNIVGWDHVIASSSFAKGTMLEGRMIEKGVDRSMVEGARGLPYAIPNLRVTGHIVDNGVPTLWWRSVGHSHNAYSTETFLDELLALGGKDPVAGRLALLSDQPRYAAVLRRVAELASWSGSQVGGGRARGVALHGSFGSFVAQIAEVSVGKDGLPKVHKVFCAVDCGVAVNPDVVRAQMEGGIGYGLGHALYSEITIEEGGRVREGNFDTYRSLRIGEMPDVEVAIVQSTEAPTGVGEPGLPPAAPAVANAFRVLTGKRVRHLPFTRALSGSQA